MTVEGPVLPDLVVGSEFSGVLWFFDQDLTASTFRIVFRRGRATSLSAFADLSSPGDVVVTLETAATVETTEGDFTGNHTKAVYTLTPTSAMVGRGEMYVTVDGAEVLWMEWHCLEKGAV